MSVCVVDQADLTVHKRDGYEIVVVLSFENLETTGIAPALPISNVCFLNMTSCFRHAVSTPSS